MKLPPFLAAARNRWLAQTVYATLPHRQAGEEALALVAEAYARTPAYNHQLQLDELRAHIRRLEADLVAERAATLKLSRQLDQPRSPKNLSKTQLEQLRTTELNRLRTWLGISEKEISFSHNRLHAVQTEFRRRLTHLERKKPI